MTYISIIIIVLSILVLLKVFLIDNVKENEVLNKLQPIDNLNNPKVELEQEIILTNDKIGSLTIPSINLYDIQIFEGVELETLASAIGHFENTNIYEGNVGLASHNAGTNANYFADINKLKQGDSIYYETKYGIKKYNVSQIVEIDSYDWSYLEETKDNRITLITCISEKPNARLCVQAIESD